MATCLPPDWTASTEDEVDHLFSIRLAPPVASPVAETRVRAFHLLFCNLARRARSLDRDEVLAALESELQLCVGEWAPERVFLHAGVVGWRGRALLLPGLSFAGKSTLVQALLHAGAEYLSDEFAVLDEQGRVHPYPRRLALRRPDGVDRPTAETLGASVCSRPLPVGLVAHVRYHPEGATTLRPVAPGRAVLDLLGHALAARRDPQRVLQTVQRMAAGAIHVRGLRGEAQTCIEPLFRLLEQAREPALPI